jgi:branched-chain amino acid transport system permease protein
MSAAAAFPELPVARPRIPPTVVRLLVLAGILFPLILPGQFGLFLATQAAVMMLVAIGLNLLVGYAGQVSLGHGGLVALGSYTTALLMVDAHWSFWTAGAAGMVVATLVGMLMALPALRLSTWYFALVTLTFSQVVTDLAIEWRPLTRGFGGIVGIPAPALFGQTLSPAQVYLAVAATVVLAFWITRNLVRSRFGLGMVAARDNPLAASASGVSLWRIKLFAFAVSAAMAGLAGAYFAIQKTVITPEDFGTDFSIFFLLMIVVGGQGRLWGPVVGTLVFFMLPELMGALQSWRMLVYGALLLVLMVFAPKGIAGMPLWRRWFGEGARWKPALDPSENALPAVQAVALCIDPLVKQFGGVKALDGSALVARAGATHALVGPNGSGKTTTLNVVSGLIRPDQGRVRLGETDITGLMPDEVARLGVGRTFQTPKLLGDMTVMENVRLGGYLSEQAHALEVAIRLPRARRDETQAVADAMTLLRFVGLAQRAHDLAGDLPHGQQRLLEIARALARHPSLLLLDEPAAGLSMDELDRLGALIHQIAARGTTVLIVEHHLELIARISQEVTVLDRGRVLTAGTPAEVFRHPEVERAYMGREKAEEISA